MQEIKAPEELVRKVFKMNEVSVGDVTGRLFRFAHELGYKPVKLIQKVGGENKNGEAAEGGETRTIIVDKTTKTILKATTHNHNRRI